MNNPIWETPRFAIYVGICRDEVALNNMDVDALQTGYLVVNKDTKVVELNTRNLYYAKFMAASHTKALNELDKLSMDDLLGMTQVVNPQAGNQGSQGLLQ